MSMTWRDVPIIPGRITAAESVRQARAVRQRVFCHACYSGFSELGFVTIEGYGAVTACADPVACRRRALRAGLWGATGAAKSPVLAPLETGPTPPLTCGNVDLIMSQGDPLSRSE